MPTPNRFRLVLLASVAGLTLAACGNRGPAQPAPETDADSPATAEPAVDSTPVGQISSGTSAPVPTVAEPVRPTQEGATRPVTLSEAIDAMPFAILAAKSFPSNAHLDLVHIIEPLEGAEAPGLPAVRLIYTLEAGGSVVVYQSAATGVAPEGEPITIAGQTGAKTGTDPLVLTWEADGVRVELRGSGVDEATLMAVAEALGPAEPADANIGASPIEAAPPITPIPAATEG
jgi:hypothetical protein